MRAKVRADNGFGVIGKGGILQIKPQGERPRGDRLRLEGLRMKRGRHLRSDHAFDVILQIHGDDRPQVVPVNREDDALALRQRIEPADPPTA